MTGFVYILKSLKNASYYIGSTSDIDRRIQEHRVGKSKYTGEILPVMLVFSQKFESLVFARKVEYWLKKQKSRKLIEQIIEEGVIKKKF